MKDWIKIGLIAGAGYLALRIFHKNPTGAMREEDFIEENTIDSLSYRKLVYESFAPTGDRGYYIKVQFHNGANKNTVVDTETFEFYLNKAQRDGAQISEF